MLPAGPAAPRVVAPRWALRQRAKAISRYSPVSTPKASRQGPKSTHRPPSTWPNTMPRICPEKRRARVAWRCSAGTRSDTVAIDIGMMPAAATPVRMRQAVSISRLGASAAPRLPTAHRAVARVTMRKRSKRSPRGP